jgi:hypothetical protein
MEAEPGRVGDDHRAAVRLLRVDRREVERDLRRGRRADDERGPRPARRHRAMKMAGDHRDDVAGLRDHFPKPPHPRRVAILRHPAEAGLDRRVVERDQGRPVGLLLEPRAQPLGAGLAEAAAVPPFLQRVEDEDADRAGLDCILDETLRGLRFRKRLEESGPAVMIAEREADRERQAVQSVPQPPVGAGVRRILDQVAGGEQQVRARRHPGERPQHRVEPPPVELVRIVAVEPQMHVGDLSDQHQPPPSIRGTLCRRSAPIRWRMTMAGAPSSRW